MQDYCILFDNGAGAAYISRADGQRKVAMQQSLLGVVTPKSLADQVADAIVEGIASRAIAPGQRITEAELASQLRVSRIPIREALKILNAQGIVVSRPHYGVRVAEFDDRRIEQLYEVRCALEKIAVRDACARRAELPGLLHRLDAIVERMARSLDRGDLIGVSKADLEFHHAICLASGNEIVITLWDALSRHMLIVFEQELLGDAERPHIVDHHRALRAAIESLPPRRLGQVIEKHIMRLRGMPKRQGGHSSLIDGAARPAGAAGRAGRRPEVAAEDA
jgi:DNA-binding GntR family transcriptional regulator